ncbi:hypothetical protein GCM10022255_053890 [Dactylosporangium darangshiense]|uniref:Uncharacterized protein n=1 Tax=Dactylosporangium darangshiense TaxID=579108 RepID=A0ABP8DEE9_9ACTN
MRRSGRGIGGRTNVFVTNVWLVAVVRWAGVNVFVTNVWVAAVVRGAATNAFVANVVVVRGVGDEC